jgi:hypothetical protein
MAFTGVYPERDGAYMDCLLVCSDFEFRAAMTRHPKRVRSRGLFSAPARGGTACLRPVVHSKMLVSISMLETCAACLIIRVARCDPAQIYKALPLPSLSP